MNKRRVIGLVLFIVIVVPAALAVRLYRNLPAEPLALGAPVPRYEVEPVRGARPLPQQGRRVTLFFSPACPHCKEVMSQFEQMRGAHPEWFAGDEALHWAFISIAGKAETEAFAEASPWPVYYDPERRALKALHGVGIPYLVLVDENGIVRYRHNGERGMASHEALLAAFYQTGRVSAELADAK